ncbi:MAG: hypothetical protein HY897_13145 [Deltaproteobacteria bacterium]|nr:hypothetical protein [Deltaproteobacteria bacterium]
MKSARFIQVPDPKRAALHALGGAALAYAVLHPAAMVIQVVSTGYAQHAVQAFLDSFSRGHLPMSAYFAILGAALGVAHSFYVQAVVNRDKVIATLENFLPICSGCKKIRREGADPAMQDSWEPVESHFTKKTGVLFSHGLCPACIQKFYPNDEETK